MVGKFGLKCYAEIGIGVGDTTSLVAEKMPDGGAIHLFDYQDRVELVAARIAKEQGPRLTVTQHGNQRLIYDSYNWSLMKLLRMMAPPVFDYVYLDGAHTWYADALAFLLVDRFIRPGGLLEFDDYNWSIDWSLGMQKRDGYEHYDANVKRLVKEFTPEQMAAKQVKLVVELLVKSDPKWRTIVENRLFKKER